MKKLLFILVAMIISISANSQTFTVVEVMPYSGISQKNLNESKNFIGTEIKLTFTDDDVRVSIADGKGGYKSNLLQKKGNNIYRKSTIVNNPNDWDSYDEIELDTFMGYIKGFTFTHIHHGSFGGGFKAKRQ